MDKSLKDRKPLESIAEAFEHDSKYTAKEILDRSLIEARMTTCWRCGHSNWDVTNEQTRVGLALPAYDHAAQFQQQDSYVPCAAVTCMACGQLWLLSIGWIVTKLMEESPR